MGDSVLKKIFVSLGIVALVAALGIAITFAYGSYKDLEMKKEETKVAKEKEKKAKEKKTKKEKKEQEEEKEENNESSFTSEETDTQETYDQTQNNTPASEAPAKETPSAQNQNNNQTSSKEKSEAPDSSYDPDEAYARQKEMYEKAARGEIPEPGAQLSGDNSKLIERDPSTLTNDELDQRQRKLDAEE